MKNVISVLLMVVLCIGSVIPVYAEEDQPIWKALAVNQLGEMETERLKISKMTEEDIEVLADYFDINVRYYFICSDVDMTRSEVCDYLISRLTFVDRVVQFTIKDKENNHIGVVQISQIDENCFNIGYWISQPFWGNGYVYEACCKIIDEIGKILPDIRFRIKLDCENKRSQRVAEKIMSHFCNGPRNSREVQYTYERKGPISIRHVVSNEREIEPGVFIADFSEYVGEKCVLSRTLTKSEILGRTYKKVFDTGELVKQEYHYVMMPIRS